MTPPIFALCLACVFTVNTAHSETLDQSSLQLKTAYVGESVTLRCLCQDKSMVMFYWYKQILGQKPELVSTFYVHRDDGTFQGEFSKDPRFKLDTGKTGKNDLTISHLRTADTATFYCVGSNLHDFRFCEGMILSVKDPAVRVQPARVQSASETIQPGGSVTLNCTVHTGTCDGEHSVYWFKKSEESSPGLIYTHGGRNDQCERKPDTQTHTCVFNLLMKNMSVTDAGAYYCAVASCGHILFGDGIVVKVCRDCPSGVLVHFLSGALAFTTVLVILLAFSLSKMYKRNCPPTVHSTPDTELCQEEENLHYAALRNYTISRSRTQRDDTFRECVYSTVKQ